MKYKTLNIVGLCVSIFAVIFSTAPTFRPFLVIINGCLIAYWVKSLMKKS